MSKDIRNFFKPLAKTSITEKTASKKIILISSDEDEDVIEISPEAHHKSKTANRKKTPTSAKKADLKPVDATNLFSKTPVKQTKSSANIKDEERRKKRDDAFNKTLAEMDANDIDMDNLNKTIDEALTSGNEHTVVTTPKGNRKRKAEEDLNESGLDPDQERYEKRRHSAALYQKYLNRERPANEGHKEYPEGNSDCLKGLCFLKTGVLDSLDSESLNNLVKKFGGRTVSAVSRKINYVIVGHEPGPSKIQKVRNFGLKEITEDQLLDMILIKSGKPPRYCKNNDGLTEDSPTLKEIKNPIKQEKQETIRTPPIKQMKTSEMKQTSHDIKPKISTPVKISKLPSSSSGEKEIAEPENSQTWTEKYKPSNIKNIIGQQQPSSNMRRLLEWLRNWNKNHLGKNKPVLKKPSPFAKNDDGAYFKCALLSGPPGVGKTTTASLVASELGYDVVEFNASDTRNKKLLHEQVSQLLSSKSIATFFKDGKAPTVKHVLLMDEVDGMSGNQDRGGIQEIIALIKNTSIPIICMCNDRQHPKIRSLGNYCFDLRFGKIKPEAIVGAMMSVCFKEGLQISNNALLQIITATGMDIRQTLNHLSMLSSGNKNISNDVVEQEKSSLQKDVVIGPWEVVRKVFSVTENASKTLAERAKLFYQDYSIGPLFVQENYLSVEPACDKKQTLKQLSLAADAIAMGDVISTTIRNTNNWSLMESQAMYSSVMPGFYMQGNFRDMINFPGWLGKNSKRNKFQRMLCELQSHMKSNTFASKEAVNLDYIYHLRNKIVTPLKSGTPGVSEAVETMCKYSLVREDLDNMLELSQWPKTPDPMKAIESKVKAAFTREYNRTAVLSYSLNSTIKKNKSSSSQSTEEEYAFSEEIDVDGNVSEDDKDDISNDAMIKKNKKNESKAKNEAGSTLKKIPSRGKASAGKGKKGK